MNAFDAVITLCGSVLLILVAVGIHNLQTWVEHANYQRHFNDWPDILRQSVGQR